MWIQKCVGLGLVVVIFGCGGSSEGGDGGSNDGGLGDGRLSVCTTDDDCDDGVFCNGSETCMPGAPDADEGGCVSSTGRACLEGQICDEDAAGCLSDCSLAADADGDGHDAELCGGDDCDDGDPNAFPGNAEVCDSAGHDEDCNPATLGSDMDSDGFVSMSCCQLDDGGALSCGRDCNDSSADIRPTAPENCNGVDDNCDGATDEGVQLNFYPDCDGDGFGAMGSVPTAACGAPATPSESCGGSMLAAWATIATDCMDSSLSVHPGAAEVCNGVDDDCNGRVDGALASAACIDPNGSAVCSGGMCTVVSCDIGYHACPVSGCTGASCAEVCKLNTELATCGDRCSPCPTDLTGGTPSCDGATCSLTCSVGYTLVGAGTDSAECLWNDATLLGLEPSVGSLTAELAPGYLEYRVDLPLTATEIALTPTSAAPNPATDVMITVNGAAIASGETSEVIALSLGDNVIEVTVTTESGAMNTYTVHVWRGRWAPGSYIKASNTDIDDYFGTSLALSGDTLVVGAPQERSGATIVNGNEDDDSADFAGAAYVFVRDGTGVWQQEAYLKAQNAEAGDRFGGAVAVSGDTIVVGARSEQSVAVNVDGDDTSNASDGSGAAYVFVRNGSGIWSQQAYLKASNTDINDAFGSSVAISGDTVVVGAPLEQSVATGVDGDGTDNSADYAGAAYVFSRDGLGVWSPEAYLKASNTQAGGVTAYDGRDQFGESVAVSGDIIVVGAPGEDSNATVIDGDESNDLADESGAAYVFLRDGMGAWGQEAYLKASNSGEFDEFGFSVAVSGDTVVVGAHREDGGASGVNGNGADDSKNGSGAAYVFVRDAGGTWSQQAYVKASDPYFSDSFGYSVAVSGDTLIVGAPDEDSAATGANGRDDAGPLLGAGAAYVFARSGTVWAQTAYLKASNTGGGDRFGISVAVSGSTVTSGAYWEDSNATGIDGDGSNDGARNSGAAYAFSWE